MKSLKYLFTIAVLTAALAVSAKADLMFLGFTDFASQPNNNPDSNLAALQTFLAAQTPPVDASGFVLAPGGNHENLSGDTEISVTPGDYIVAHYGGPQGGSLEFFQVINNETLVTVPGNPNPLDDLASPNSLSSAREFGPGGGGVPDSGTTAMLLGGALAGLALGRRYLKR
jgi:hypothetical protein